MKSLSNSYYIKIIILIFLFIVNYNFVLGQQNSKTESEAVKTVSETLNPGSIGNLGDKNSSGLSLDDQINSFIMQLNKSNELAYEQSDFEEFLEQNIIEEPNLSENKLKEIEEPNLSENKLKEIEDEKIKLEKFQDNNENDSLTDIEVNALLEELSNENFLDKKEPDVLVENELENNTIQNSSEKEILVLPSVSLEPIEEIKISSIGSDRKDYIPFDSWRGTSISRAAILLQNTSKKYDSVILKGLLSDLISSSLEPPLGEGLSDIKFTSTRLNTLLDMGEVRQLRKLIDILPSDEEFDEWREWRVKDSFLQGDINYDDLACNIVEGVSIRNPKPFWKLSHVFCLLIQGKEDDASFDAELLKASGIEDKNFYSILDTMLGNQTQPTINSDELNLLHVIMMDQIRNSTPHDFISSSHISFFNSLLKLQFLQPRSIAFILDNLIEQKLVNEEKIKEMYNLIGDTSLNIDNVLVNLKNNPGPQSRADAWVVINNISDLDNKSFQAFQAIALEAENGRPLQALQLYLPMIGEKNLKGIYNEMFEKLNLIYFLYLNNFSNEAINETPESSIAKLFLMKSGDVWDFEILDQLNLIDLIPILDSAGMKHPKIDFLLKSLNEYEINEKIKSNYLLHKLALDNSLNNKSFAETIFISGLIVQGRNLSDISSQEVSIIMESWKKLGLDQEMRNFAREWLMHRLILEITNEIIINS